jgi:hypothetical protein
LLPLGGNQIQSHWSNGDQVINQTLLFMLKFFLFISILFYKNYCDFFPESVAIIDLEVA